MAKAGRPSIYSDDLASLICSRIAEGESLRSICRDDKMPATSTVFAWLDGNEEFRTKYTRAREIQQELEAEGLTGMADEEPPQLPNGAVDNGWVQWQKNRIATRQWIASKLLPKKYGDKVAVGGAEDLPAIKAEIDPTDAVRRLAFLLAKGAQSNGG